jgi:hypothetical protein
MNPAALHVGVGLMDIFDLERNAHEARPVGADDFEGQYEAAPFSALRRSGYFMILLSPAGEP